MSSIELEHAHRLPLAAARTLVDDIASGLANRYQVTSNWRGDSLQFQRPGISGHIDVTPNAIHVSARLGLLLATLRPAIEREIRAELQRRLGA